MDQPASQSNLRIPIWLLRFLQFLQKHEFNTAHSRSLYNCGWFVSIFHYLFLYKVPILVPLFLLRVLSRCSHSLSCRSLCMFACRDTFAIRENVDFLFLCPEFNMCFFNDLGGKMTFLSFFYYVILRI